MAWKGGWVMGVDHHFEANGSADAATGERARSCAVLVGGAFSEASVASILVDLEEQRGWRASGGAVIVWAFAASSRAAVDALRPADGTPQALLPGFCELRDGEVLARGGRYFVPALQRAWFERSEEHT